MTPLRKTYSFSLQPKGLTETGKHNVLGLECTLWTEWVKDREKMYYNLLPRLAVAAELGWTEGEKDYSAFCRRLQSHYAFYESWGYPYAHGKEKPIPFIKRLQTLMRWKDDPYVEVKEERKR